MPALTVVPIELDDLTEQKIGGAGVLDVLMKTMSLHLDQEHTKQRIKGAEYSQVYLESFNSILKAAMDFLLTRQDQNLKAQLLEQQILLAQVEVLKANAELAILQANLAKIPHEIELLQAQVALENQKALNLADDLLTQATQRLKIQQETANLLSVKANIEAETALRGQQLTNAIQERLVMIAQECKLKADFDLAMANVTRTGHESTLLQQKVITERAQTQNIGVDENSVIGRQKTLYQRQSEGFLRDAEQKAAQILTGAWQVDRTAGEASANSTNQLADAFVGRAIARLLAGAGA
ncbi:MAG: hypothetical protein E6R03_03980 [Hyphomicrobiaceae bacterium]|nr:MAG: hypothetical protein E6R03_03980 [Hyphomicrobiaceae bacterium]